MSAEPRSSDTRPYRQRKRAEQVGQTRQRIIDAAVHLHTTVGPANTTVSALAEHAGVTRLTVYRHFSDLDSLFEACSAQWAALHPAPDPSAWRMIKDVGERARHALTELYGWYRDHGDELLPIYRDLEAMPPSAQQAAQAALESFADGLVAGSELRGHARRRLRAAAGHVVSFWTWRSLTAEQGLDNTEAAELAASWLVSATRR